MMNTKNLLLKTAFAGLLFMTPFAQAAAQGVELEWAKQIGGTDREMGKKIRIDNWGNVYSTGYFKGTVDFDPGAGVQNLTSAGRDDAYISKLDAEGNFKWARRMGGNDTDQNLSGDQGTSIAVDAAGNVYTTGYFTGVADFNSGIGAPVVITANGGWDIFVTKHDSAGNFQWVKTFGGKWYDEALAITVDDHYIYFAGDFADTVDFDPGTGIHNMIAPGNDAFICKLDLAGNFVWSKQFTGNGFTSCYGIDVDRSGNVYTAGQFSRVCDFDPGTGTCIFTSTGPLMLQDVFVSKLDSSGTFVWAKQIGGDETDMGNDISLDPWGNVFVTGRFARDADFDPGPGTFNLSSTFNTSFNIPFFPDAFIVKLNTNGVFSWAKKIGGQELDEGYGLKTDKSGNLYATGYFNGTAKVDTFTLNATNGMWDADVYVIKFDSSGLVKWTKQMGGQGSDFGYGIAVASGNVYTTGYFSGTANFNPGTGTYPLTAIADYDIFVHKMTCSDTTIARFEVQECNSYTFNGSVYTQSGNYVTRQPNAEGCDSTLILDLVINNIEQAVINVNEFELGTAIPYTTYQWMKNGVLIPGATQQLYQVTENADYSVVVTDANGCIDTADIYTVTNYTSIENINGLAAIIRLYPNPTNEVVYLNSPVPVDLTISSVEGKILRKTKGAKEVSLKGMPEGIYLFHIIDEDGRLINVEKMVKQR